MAARSRPSSATGKRFRSNTKPKQDLSSTRLHPDQGSPSFSASTRARDPQHLDFGSNISNISTHSSTANDFLRDPEELGSRVQEASVRLADAEARIRELEAEEAERRRAAEQATTELEQLKQLQHYAEMEDKLRQTQSRIEELGASREMAELDARDVTAEMDTLRSALYELPPTHHSPSKKLNKLQAEAYIERHDLDLLASLIEFMPAYPYPFMIKLLKRKAGIRSDELEIAQKKTADVTAALEDARAHAEQLQEELDHANHSLDEMKGLLDSTQRELKEAGRELDTVTQQDKKIIAKLERELEDTQRELSKEKNNMLNLEGSLRASQDDVRSAQKELKKAQREAAKAEEQAQEITRLKQQIEKLQQQNSQDKAELRRQEKEISKYW